MLLEAFLGSRFWVGMEMGNGRSLMDCNLSLGHFLVSGAHCMIPFLFYHVSILNVSYLEIIVSQT